MQQNAHLERLDELYLYQCHLSRLVCCHVIVVTLHDQPEKFLEALKQDQELEVKT